MVMKLSLADSEGNVIESWDNIRTCRNFLEDFDNISDMTRDLTKIILTKYENEIRENVESKLSKL